MTSNKQKARQQICDAMRIYAASTSIDELQRLVLALTWGYSSRLRRETLLEWKQKLDAANAANNDSAKGILS